MTRARVLSAALLGLVAATPVAGDGFRIRTEFGLGGSFADASSHLTALDFQESYRLGGNARLMWQGATQALDFELHATFNIASGSQVAASRALAFSSPLPPPTLFDLSHSWFPDDNSMAIATIDRASVSFASDQLVLKSGRQAITWGSGLVFHPSDIVAPFAPDAIDTTYKPGVDMVYVQYLFDNGADIQAIAVPRAASWGGPVTRDQSTLALRAAVNLNAFDLTLMAALDRGDQVGGIGLSGPLGGASWNAEYVHWKLASGENFPSWLFNITNFGTLGDWNISYFAEYFHNGFGVDAATPLDALPVSLTRKMSTGHVFFGGEDFLALGGQIQMTADLSVAPGAIISLNDSSALASFGLNYTLGDNTDLSFDYAQPIGPDGSEFGGRETSSGSGIFVGPARSATLRLVHYF